MRASAASIQRLCALPRISAAKITPVPMGRVSTSRSPGRMPDFRSKSSGGAVPVTENPMASSPPSLVCPPTRATPSRSRTSSAPAMSWVRSASIFSSAANGSVTIAIAASGSAPIAKMSPSA